MSPRDGRVAVATGVLAVVGLALGAACDGRTPQAVQSGWPAELAPASAAGFDVLLVTLDTTRRDRLGCYGHAGAETPVLDGLAASGLRVDDAVTVVPVTLPSHASILTGLYPPRHGVRDNGEYRLGSEHTTLAEMLSDAGYETAAFVSAFVLDGRFGLEQGFDHYDDSIRAASGSAISDLIDERSAADVTSAAIDWLGGRSPERPWFAWVHFFDPHQPYRAPEPYRSRLAADPYDAEIAYVDAQLGRLLEALRAMGRADRTLILVVADHGEGLGEHGEETHTVLIYGSVMRVPLLLAAPGLFPGGRVLDEPLVATVDVLPTLVDLLGLEGAPRGDGISMLDAAALRERTVYLESLVPYLDYGWAPLYGLRAREDKLIQAPAPEYFDLLQDPQELNNRYGDPPAGRRRVDRLESRLAGMMASWPDAETAGREATPLDPETRERLESLGYLGGIDPDPDAAARDPKEMMGVMRRIGEAKMLAQAGDYPRAIDALERIAAESPPCRTVLGQLARIYARLGRSAEAESALRRSIAIRPSAASLVMLAQLLLKERRFDDVETLIDQALRLEPSNGAAFIARGDHAAASGRFDAAAQAYRRAGEVDPHRVGRMAADRLAHLERYRGKLRSD